MSLPESEHWKLPAELWANDRFPSMEDYRRILRRGRLHYSLDADKLGVDRVGPSIADRPANLLYTTASQGYCAPGDWGFKGPSRNEFLLPHIEEHWAYNKSLHSRGIPVIVWQNENNFHDSHFSKIEIDAMQAELDPFTWAFGSERRRFACNNKPGWRDFLLERLRIRVGEQIADGLFLDNITPFIHCRCSHCQKLYAEYCGGNMIDDMGIPYTVVADMRVFNYVGPTRIPKQLQRLTAPVELRYLEWRIDRQIEFHRDIRTRLETALGREVIFTSNGHFTLAEQTAVQLACATDMRFSEEGFAAPPVSNMFSLRVGAALGKEQAAVALVRTAESVPTPDMIRVLAAEGLACGCSAEFWDHVIRTDERLMMALLEMREFEIEHADALYAVEEDANDTALVYSWRSDLWAGHAISPASHVADLLEDLNVPYDVLFAERESDIQRLSRYRLVIFSSVEIVPESWFRAVSVFLSGGGKVIATGSTATLDSNIQPRADRWSGDGFIHINGTPEADYFQSRRPFGMHTPYQRPDGLLASAIDEALIGSSVAIETPLPVLTVNHTRLPDGEAIHIVNRFVNVWPVIDLVHREGISLRIRPAKPAKQIVLIRPGYSTQDITAEPLDDYLRICLPKLESYNVVKVCYLEI